MQYQVIFQPSGRRGLVEEGKTLLEASRELGVDIENLCGGAGVCGKCVVKIEEGIFDKFGITSKKENLSPISNEEKNFFTEEKLADNYRLSCVAQVKGDILVFVPEESRGAQQVVLETGADRSFAIRPAVKKYYITMEPATLEDHRGDLQRLNDALTAQHGLPSGLTVDLNTLRTLPKDVRKEDWKVTVFVWQDKEIIKVVPGEVEKYYGLGIDIGTTSIAAYLCDMDTGESVVVDSLMNPQVRYGEDVLSRVTYAMMNDNGLELMREAMVDGLNTLATRMTEKIGLKAEDVCDIVLVFNTVMHHIALGIEPKFVGRSPFAAGTKESLDIKARDMGVNILPSAFLHALPVEAGFVGPDNVSVLIAEAPYNQEEEVQLIIDIGTNGEIDLGNKKRMLCTSCATGPALEGAQIKFGMRAAPGAIEKIEISPEDFSPKYKVIGSDIWFPENKDPQAKGICGSGIIDVIAEMFRAGVVEKTGRINTKSGSERIRKGEDGKMMEYVLCWASETSIGKDIVVTQADVRAVQLAKSALYVGAKYLLQKYGNANVDRVTLAGAFGSYINRESAMLMGMIPDCDLEKVQAVGNAAGDGAKMALLDVKKREEAQWIAKNIEFVETATEPGFQSEFSDAMWFPHAKDQFPHIQHLLDKIVVKKVK